MQAVVSHFCIRSGLSSKFAVFNTQVMDCLKRGLLPALFNPNFVELSQRLVEDAPSAHVRNANSLLFRIQQAPAFVTGQKSVSNKLYESWIVKVVADGQSSAVLAIVKDACRDYIILQHVLQSPYFEKAVERKDIVCCGLSVLAWAKSITLFLTDLEIELKQQASKTGYTTRVCN